MTKLKKQTEVEYIYRGGRKFPVLAEVAGAELDRIRQKHGELKARLIVEESREDAAPLHPVFEWDNFTAAEHYRSFQARNLVSAVLSRPVGSDAEPRRVYVHIPSQQQSVAGAYESVETVLQRPDLFLVAVEALTRQSNALMRTVRELEAAASGSEDSDRLTNIAMAVRAAEMFSTAVKALH